MENKEIPQVIKSTAIIEDGIFNHFGIRPITASLYGHKEEEIVDVELTISDNQEIPELNINHEAVDYWGWFDYITNEVSLVYVQYFLLNMCFPSGVKCAEEMGRGKSLRFNVKKI
jgi:hypothetical protein